jgi:hypothetical protein
MLDQRNPYQSPVVSGVRRKRSTPPRPWLTATLYVTALLVVTLFPTFGPPHFRYNGADPSVPVWNIGLIAIAIYDARSGLHLGPMPFEQVLLTALLIAAMFGVFFLMRRFIRFIRRAID